MIPGPTQAGRGVPTYRGSASTACCRRGRAAVHWQTGRRYDAERGADGLERPHGRRGKEDSERGPAPPSKCQCATGGPSAAAVRTGSTRRVGVRGSGAGRGRGREGVTAAAPGCQVARQD
eukprot:993392-Rhodomonas_salina.1